MKTRFPLALRLVLLILLLQVSHAGAQAVTAVTALDLTRYAGKWFEIARFPNKFQADCIGDVSAVYRQRTDGDIDVINSCKKNNGAVEQAVGLAKLPNQQDPAKLKVRFAPAWLSWLPMVWGDYWVLELAPDYSIAAVGEPGRDYLWILARSPVLPEPVYQALLKRMAVQGFDTAKLVRTAQNRLQ